MEVLFWLGFGVILYTYIGYPVVLGVLVRLRKNKGQHDNFFVDEAELPEITLVVACFNEADILDQKIQNTLQLDYPTSKRNLFFVTDGSSDNSGEIIQKYPELKLFHENARKGKNAAVNRVMAFVKTPIVIFCDANTFLNKKALQLIARHYKDENVGAVAGEKRVMQSEQDNAASSGEGAYWKYESKLKKWDSELHTVVGAAGELFSIRTSLYEQVPAGVLIEDFRLSMNIAKKGFRVIYEPEAYAMETSSESMGEEHKRKVRISAGGLIEVWYFRDLLNIFKYGWLSFQYVSHRMLRWTFAPLGLLVLLITNIFLAADGNVFYGSVFIAQLLFYFVAIAGYLLRNRKIRFKILFVPYYFLFMNLSVYQGLFRLLRGKQSAVWDKAKRAQIA
ncbi:MAG: glycosyl transferase [Azospira oryzae]|jgi:biofilm PGA synthesis N-glycosyltransferase PgaC|nr:MAG: glycosyl transferase [Azospira oryzae]